MKRYGHLFNQIISIENLRLADQKARKGKRNQAGVQLYDLNAESNLFKLHESLLNGTFQTSQYSTFNVYEPKERLVYCLPYYPDRIVHHAIMNVLEPVLVGTMTRDTYSCIKGRGISGAFNHLQKALRDIPATKFCLKLDIRKFYPSIDHEILKQILRRKIKDSDLLRLLDEIIESTDGVPIGNYLSQFFANFYLCYFDHWIKEELKVKYYFRYADDIVILSDSKKWLHLIRFQISNYLSQNLKLEVKGNYQVFPVSARSIDFIGYRFYHTHILLRKSIKKNFARAVKKKKPHSTMAAYMGWASHGNCKNLIKKLTHEKVQ
jgi:retron-type reverse transcriptase